MSLVELFAIWCRRRGKPPPRARRDLRAGTVDCHSGRKSRRGGVCRMGMGKGSRESKTACTKKIKLMSRKIFLLLGKMDFFLE